MNPISYLRKNGIKHALKVVYQYKIDKVIIALLKPFLKNKPLQNIIIIESHNDFDCNGGAFYEYLIRNGYNKKYKIVWLLKHPELKPNDLPENVVCVPLFKPNIMKDYYICRAKIFTADNTVTDKVRDDQQSYYFGHGGGSLKNIKNVFSIPSSVDYVLLQSPSFAPLQASQFSMTFPNKKFLFLGFPYHDVINSKNTTEIKKITINKYEKVILWMPTFRKANNSGRVDSIREYPLGIPLIYDVDTLLKFNRYLEENNILVVIKIHPMQDLNDIKFNSMSNIKLLTGIDVKEMKIDNYRLMSCADALISDYSGVAFDFLQLNRPIAYVLDDMSDYKLGFIVDDIDSLIAGKKINKYDDLTSFIDSVCVGIDNFKTKREKIRHFVYTYFDTENCIRLSKYMKL